MGKILFSKHFGIESSRISTKGQSKPNISSKQPGGTLELDLLEKVIEGFRSKTSQYY
jgi:hypothetical protein